MTQRVTAIRIGSSRAYAPPSLTPTPIPGPPCSGVGALRHRPDARWRIDQAAPDRLAALQFDLLREAERVVKPGGVVLYSVCTLTDAETVAVDARVHRELPRLAPVELGEPW